MRLDCYGYGPDAEMRNGGRVHGMLFFIVLGFTSAGLSSWRI